MKAIITYVMPCVGRKPMGGFKIVYEYANRLVNDGYCVFIINPISLTFRHTSLYTKCKIIYLTILNKLGLLRIAQWFNLDKRVKNLVVPNLSQKYIPKTDICIATGAQTACYVNNYKKIERKYYFIQGYETWAVGMECLIETYKYKLKKIVIAEWLRDKVREVGEDAVVIHNGFDFNFFKCTNKIETRNKYNIIMPYSKVKLKGSEIGLKAVELVRQQFPEVSLTLFGTQKPKNLPSWCMYYRQPDRKTFNEIYNRASIFLGPSFTEGFCLTPPEAMQCGCAVVCTKIGGYEVVCKDNVTALLGEVNNAQSLANCIIRLIKDDALRIRIAYAGYNYIKSFTWEKSYEKLLSTIGLV